MTRTSPKRPFDCKKLCQHTDALNGDAHDGDILDAGIEFIIQDQAENRFIGDQTEAHNKGNG